MAVSAWLRGRVEGRVIAGWLLLFALVMRAAIPAGWMPNTSGVGNAPLIICSADRPGHPEKSPAKTPPGAPHGSADRHEACAFSGVGAAPAPAVATISGPPEALLPAEPAPLRARPAHDARGHREQAARAPPLQV